MSSWLRFRNAKHGEVLFPIGRASAHTWLDECWPARRMYPVNTGNPMEAVMQDRESHGKAIDELVSGFRTHLVQGLTQQEALDRLAKFGANELTERPRPGFLALLWDQFNNYLVIILI